MDQKDLFAFFLTLKKQYSEDEIPKILEMYEITKLDVNRIYRYLDKYTEKTDTGPNPTSGGGCCSGSNLDNEMDWGDIA
jgi:hypothetical protein